ncbi:hypothetical protein [Parahaliea mediterranea]|uniref:Uncharacterized protein n=1 Tax=Parahaliea mediterranea TaxID=651086 RepID=A0A939DHC5_9GAMM|nr:hypothetical protein [Parahaliea mediterranea]MBN7798278.1 hypothetical protein [Parahaliea mediterranea]
MTKVSLNDKWSYGIGAYDAMIKTCIALGQPSSIFEDYGLWVAKVLSISTHDAIAYEAGRGEAVDKIGAVLGTGNSAEKTCDSTKQNVKKLIPLLQELYNDLSNKNANGS